MRCNWMVRGGLEGRSQREVRAMTWARVERGLRVDEAQLYTGVDLCRAVQRYRDGAGRVRRGVGRCMLVGGAASCVRVHHFALLLVPSLSTRFAVQAAF